MLVPDEIRAFIGKWGHITVEEVPEPDPELVALIRQIKQHKEPPWRDDDIWYGRQPWPKFGGVGGISYCWHWFLDDVILEKATKDDMLAALAEFEEETK